MKTKAEYMRLVVKTFAPEALDTYDSLVAKPIQSENGRAPTQWTDAMRAEVALYIWRDYDPSRPN